MLLRLVTCYFHQVIRENSIFEAFDQGITLIEINLIDLDEWRFLLFV